MLSPEGKAPQSNKIAPGGENSVDELEVTADQENENEEQGGANKNAGEEQQEENEEKTSRDAQLRAKLSAIEQSTAGKIFKNMVMLLSLISSLTFVGLTYRDVEFRIRISRNFQLADAFIMGLHLIDFTIRLYIAP